jgi:hypothetical protein
MLRRAPPKDRFTRVRACVGGGLGAVNSREMCAAVCAAPLHPCNDLRASLRARKAAARAQRKRAGRGHRCAHRGDATGSREMKHGNCACDSTCPGLEQTRNSKRRAFGLITSLALSGGSPRCIDSGARSQSSNNRTSRGNSYAFTKRTEAKHHLREDSPNESARRYRIVNEPNPRAACGLAKRTRIESQDCKANPRTSQDRITNPRTDRHRIPNRTRGISPGLSESCKWVDLPRQIAFFTN